MSAVEWAVRYPDGRVHIIDPPSGPIAEGQARDLAALEATAARDVAEATLKSELTVDAIRTARYVRDRFGWHRVVRVNAKSVTVETVYSWTDRIALTDVLEARP